MSKKSKIQLQYLPFSKLVFLSDNPRTRTDEGFAKMVEDIKADPSFYENRPTLVNFTEGEFRVYAGDLRAHAAHDGLGWQEIPCNVEADVPIEVMRRRAILDNTHREDWDKDALDQWEFERDELEGMGVSVDWVSEDEDDGIDFANLGTDFSLPSGEKQPFQQMTFTLADEQATQIKNAIADIKETEEYKYAETMGNENSNGNALYLIVMQWAERRK